jgi:hypothetical protein
LCCSSIAECGVIGFLCGSGSYSDSSSDNFLLFYGWTLQFRIGKFFCLLIHTVNAMKGKWKSFYGKCRDKCPYKCHIAVRDLSKDFYLINIFWHILKVSGECAGIGQPVSFLISVCNELYSPYENITKWACCSSVAECGVGGFLCSSGSYTLTQARTIFS